MNILEAWKTAKEGQTIFYPGNNSFIFEVSKSNHGLTNLLHDIMAQTGMYSDKWLLLENWEIKKIQHTVHRTLKEFLTNRSVSKDCNIPETAKVTIEWEE